MASSNVSVIVPVYNHGKVLGDTIRSVLEQSYPSFELIVVDDGSSDDSATVARSFRDPRIRVLAHEVNRGVAAARNTGIRNAVGQLIALLDADDLFHPRKLEEHVLTLDRNEEIEVTYNSRFELHHSSTDTREIWRAPASVTLADFLQGFPFSPSDTVLRRDVLLAAGSFDESYLSGSEDLELFSRLALQNVRFGRVDQALNYRRREGRRTLTSISERLNAAVRAVEKVFSDPGCPESVRAVRPAALAYHYGVWGCGALRQGDTEHGRAFVREAIRRNPAGRRGLPSPLLALILTQTAADETTDHIASQRDIFDASQSEAAWTNQERQWAASRGHLVRGTTAAIWGRSDSAARHFLAARRLSAPVEESFLRKAVDDLLNYEHELGGDAADRALDRVALELSRIGERRAANWLRGCYSLNQAFRSDKTAEHGRAFRQACRAALWVPSNLTNRGLWAVLGRSILRTRTRGVDRTNGTKNARRPR